jgi:hypothetical protein
LFDFWLHGEQKHILFGFNRLTFVVLLLLLGGLACGTGSDAPEIAPPGGPVPVSEEAADRLKQNFYQALQEATPTNEAQLRVTNEEITSLFAKELTETGRIPLSNPQIWFTNGRIFITGGVKPFGPVEFNSLIVATAVVDNAQMVVSVQEAQMGMFGFPDAILASATDTVNEALASILLDLDITRLEILEGEMFVVGKRPG